MAHLRAIINDFSEMIDEKAQAGGAHGTDFDSLDVAIHRVRGQSYYSVFFKLIYTGSSMIRSDNFQI